MVQKYNSEENNSVQADGSGSLKKCIQKYWYWAIFVLIILGGALFAFFPRSTSSGREMFVECETVYKEAAGPREPIVITKSLDTPISIGRQIIIASPDKATIKTVLADEKIASLELEPIKTCTLYYPDEGQHDLFPGAEPGKLTMNLYRAPELDGSGQELSIEAVVEQINQAYREKELHGFAYRNLLLGSPRSICGNPDPSIGGSPDGIAELLPVGEANAVKLFWEQWAFQQIGAGPAFKNAMAGAAIQHQGKGTLVAVFDTSPFLDPWDSRASKRTNNVINTIETVKWVNPTMDLEPLRLPVSYPRWATSLAQPKIKNVPGSRDSYLLGPDVRDHGLFVAGLVHAVAPDSELRLIRVLNEFGCGDLYTFNIALQGFISEVETERGNLQGVVINLSLGVPGFTLQENASLQACATGIHGHGIALLCDALIRARTAGAVIVAAAGNGSGGETAPQPAQIPAAFECVISVQATNQAGDLACFSNKGSFSAPGGDRRGDGASSRECISIDQMSQDDYAQGIIGPVLFPPRGRTYWSTHYAYWSGTSFSAPLVSGLAALILETGVTQDCKIGDELVPQVVDPLTGAIKCGVNSVPDDVVNMPKTFTAECQP